MCPLVAKAEPTPSPRGPVTTQDIIPPVFTLGNLGVSRAPLQSVGDGFLIGGKYSYPDKPPQEKLYPTEM